MPSNVQVIMKTTMIKGTLAGLAAIGLAVGAQAQSVGFGLSFGSAGLNSFGFSYAGGNFGIGVGFNAYSPWYYPYYPYYWGPGFGVYFGRGYRWR